MANPYFNANYYLANNPDLFAAGINTEEGAWEHYVNYGAAEAIVGQASRSPAPWFDISYYYAQNPDFATAGLTPAQLFEHFVNHGIDEGRAPSADAQLTETSLLAYALANEDLADAFEVEEDATELTEDQQAALARHFYEYGYKEQREGKPVDTDAKPGQTFTLTDGLNEFVGTAGDDTFQGRAADLNGFDRLDGGAGNDTLNLYAGDEPIEPIDSTVRVKNIETINVHGAAYETIDAGRFEGAQQIWQIGGVGDIEGLSASQTAGYRDVELTVTDGQPEVEAGFTGTVANIALDGVGAEDDREIDDFTSSFGLVLEGDDVETLNVSGSTVDGANVVFDLSDGMGEGAAGETGLLSLETININLSSDTAVLLRGGVLSTSVTEIDASASTGNLSMAFVADETFQFALETLSLGSGADQVAIGLANLGADEVAVNLGAGADTVFLSGAQAEDGNAALSITLGAGRDTVVVSELTNAAISDDDAVEGIVTIADFAAAQDILDLSGNDITSFFATQNLVDAAIDGVETDGGDLFDALSAIDQYATEGVAVRFNFDGNTYVYGDSNGTFDGGEMLIELTGTVALGGNNVVFAEAGTATP